MWEKLALSIVPIDPTRKSSSELSAPASYVRESGEGWEGETRSAQGRQKHRFRGIQWSSN